MKDILDSTFVEVPVVTPKHVVVLDMPIKGFKIKLEKYYAQRLIDEKLLVKFGTRTKVDVELIHEVKAQIRSSLRANYGLTEQEITDIMTTYYNFRIKRRRIHAAMRTEFFVIGEPIQSTIRLPRREKHED